MKKETSTIETPQAEGKFSARIVYFKDYGVPDRTFVKEANSKEELFQDFYEMNRTLRYCNGMYYKFEDKAVEEEYNKWYKSLSKITRFDMYYGDGIVD